MTRTEALKLRSRLFNQFLISRNKHVETKSNNPWKDAVLNAMKSYNMDIAHYENEPDNAVCDLLYMHANAEAHRAMMDYFSKEGDSKG